MKKYINFLIAFNKKLDHKPLIILWIIFSIISGITLSFSLTKPDDSLIAIFFLSLIFSALIAFILLLMHAILCLFVEFLAEWEYIWKKIKNAFEEAVEEELNFKSNKSSKNSKNAKIKF